MSDDLAVVPYEAIEERIVLVRGHKVMLDRDLALLYGVETRALNQAVRRNRERFPEDFMFELSRDEIGRISQSVTSSWKADSLKYSKRVNVFTEHGVAMLSSVLNSPRAIQVNIRIMRSFARIRNVLDTHKVLARKLLELETKVGTHDDEIQFIFKALKRLMAEPEKKKKPIGFTAKEARGRYRK